MIISNKGLSVLAAAEMNADGEIHAVARTAKTTTATAHYHLNRLQDQKLIAKRLFVNWMRFGLLDIAMFLNTKISSPKQNQAFEKWLTAQPQVLWLGKFVGAFQYGLVFAGPSLGSFDIFFEKLCENFGDLIRTRALAPRVRYIHFGRKYLDPTQPPKSEMILEEGPLYDLDSVDRILLEHLSIEPALSIRGLAQTARLPNSTVQLRINNLKDSGLIVGKFWDLNYQSIGYTGYRVLISYQQITVDRKARSFQFAKRHPNIVWVSEAIGSWDVEFGIEVKKASELNEILNQAQEHIGSEFSQVIILQELSDISWKFFPTITKNERII